MIVDDPIVLIVDDSTNDALLMRVVFERAGLMRPLQYAVGGEAAIAYLLGTGGFRDRQQFPFPAVMLLDLNMPGTNGFEVLEWIRRQPAFKRLRIYVLSASSRPEDIERAYELGANSYLVKPRNLNALEHMVRSLVAWLKLSHYAPVQETGEKPAPAGAEDLGAPIEYRSDRLVG